MHRHTEACVWKTYPSGQQSCVTAKNERERAKRAAGTFRSGGDPKRYLRQKPDGWEAEFGPVPDRERNRDWFDQVIVDRALTKRPTGRTPYPLEWAEIIRTLPKVKITEVDLATATGVTPDHISNLKRLA